MNRVRCFRATSGNVLIIPRRVRNKPPYLSEFTIKISINCMNLKKNIRFDMRLLRCRMVAITPNQLGYIA